MTEPSRQVRRYHARFAAKKAATAALHEKLKLPAIRVQYDPAPLSRVARSKYVPHGGERERLRRLDVWPKNEMDLNQMALENLAAKL